MLQKGPEKNIKGKEQPEDIWKKKNLNITSNIWPEDFYEEEKSYQKFTRRHFREMKKMLKSDQKTSDMKKISDKQAEDIFFTHKKSDGLAINQKTFPWKEKTGRERPEDICKEKKFWYYAR